MLLARRATLAGLLAGAALPMPLLGKAMGEAELATLTDAAAALFPLGGVPRASYRAIVSRSTGGADAAGAAAFTAAAAALAGPVDGMPARITANFALPGIQALRVATLIGLFSDLAVVRRFGYPGPSLDQGGWLEHGFGDLAWLPEPGRAFVP